MNYAPPPTDGQLQVLAERFMPGGEIRFGHRITGGLGCTMDVLHVRERVGSEIKVVLRRRTVWPSGGNDIDAETEFQVLGHLREHGVMAPEPLWFDNEAIFDQPAMLIGFIDGEALLSPDEPLDYAEQFASALVKLHDVPLNDDLRRGLTDFNGYETSSMSREAAPEYVAGHPLGEKVWSAQRSEIARNPLTGEIFVHSDYWPGNTMWNGQELVAIVDMEEVGFGDPMIDVATAVINLRYEEWGLTAGDRFVEVYQAETGRSLNTLRYWMLRELRKPMPDIKRWLPSFREMSSRTDITADELRAIHSRLITDVLNS